MAPSAFAFRFHRQSAGREGEAGGPLPAGGDGEAGWGRVADSLGVSGGRRGPSEWCLSKGLESPSARPRHHASWSNGYAVVARRKALHPGWLG
jgi:hypothetical protein